MIELAIILLNYRTPDMTVQCLETIEHDLKDEPDWHVVVVDNNSGDDSAEKIQAGIDKSPCHAQMRLAPSPINGGYSAGNNFGIAEVEAKYYLLINSDTIVDQGALRRLVQTAMDDATIGLLGPLLSDKDGEEQTSLFNFHSPVSELLTAAKLGVLDRLLSRFRVARTLEEQASSAEADWISFACVLIRKEVLDAVGLLDDGYFMYYEDVDFCRRARKAGWRIVREPAARVIHFQGGSSPVTKALETKSRVPRYHYASRNRYFAKYYGGVIGVVLANLCRMAGRSISLLRETLSSRPRSSCKYEYQDIWTSWLKPLQRYTHSG